MKNPNVQIEHLFLLLSTICLLVNYSFAQPNDTPPNIVLILVDDLALMDLGVYGGEAATPNIDKLANQGTIFTNYHTSPSCAPSRAMLLTGYDSHLTGVPNLPLFLPPEQATKPGYEGVLNENVKTLGTHLKRRGYRTYTTGKWHLGHTEKTLPTKRGFDRSFILDASGADNYEHKAYLPTQSKPPWFADGKEIDLPADFYSSRNLVDKMMQFMDEEPNQEKPFFSYIAFQAIHIPVQAPKEFIDKYEGVYEDGWDKLRQRRFEKAKALGIVNEAATLGAMLPALNSWDSQTAEEKKLKSKAMAVNAAMIEAMDFHIGRYMNYLEQKGLMDNTVFVITSDNGPEGSDPSLVPGMGLWLKWAGYHREYENLGQRGSWNFIGPEFASAAAGPSAFFKFYAGEGGLRVPLIISGANLPHQQKKRAFSFVTDVTPTILDMAGDSTNTTPFTGRSLFPLIQNQVERVYHENDVVGIEAAGHAALFKDDMKIVRNGVPYGDGQWRMYNIQADPGETKNLSEAHPEQFQEMLTHYDTYTKDFRVLAMPLDYSLMKEVQRKFLVQVKNVVAPWGIALLVFLFGFLLLRRAKRKRMVGT
ncbi:MAG: arylsulfatase [Bacteroidota bacterium]